MDFQRIIRKQEVFFRSNTSKNLDFRLKQLKKIKAVLKANEEQLYAAIFEDFGKSEFETYMTELLLIYHELDKNIKNIRKWSKRKKVATGFSNFPAKSYIIPEPLGTVLVIGAWNYPFQLSLVPALAALAAGNTVILKPSELPVNTSKVMMEIINTNFPSEYFCVIEGGVKETAQLLEHRFDKIFFTGSIPVGKIIYQAAAKHLTPVTLELGGKSPTFVFADADIEMTVKRIAWAKFLNAGQTCVAPDYILVEQSIEKRFLEAMKKELQTNYNNELDVNYLKIINTNHFDRLEGLIDQSKIYYGGNKNRENRFLSPTLLHNISFDDTVMQEEIFGPILPVISFVNVEEAIDLVKERPKPLACYIYSKNRSMIDKLLHEISFGGGAVNDSLMHLTSSELPFGGVGLSGIGNYHGKFGFDTFSHQKGILDKPFWFESKTKYMPYTKKKQNFLRWLLE